MRELARRRQCGPWPPGLLRRGRGPEQPLDAAIRADARTVAGIGWFAGDSPDRAPTCSHGQALDELLAELQHPDLPRAVRLSLHPWLSPPHALSEDVLPDLLAIAVRSVAISLAELRQQVPAAHGSEGDEIDPARQRMRELEANIRLLAVLRRIAERCG